MKLGALSISRSVKDLSASEAFYRKLGFHRFGGDGERYLIMKNEDTLIGLFQGMFDGNLLTFNPGWDSDAQTLEEYDDVRAIQRHLQAEGIALEQAADESSSGPASMVVKDPDGFVILIDQHV